MTSAVQTIEARLRARAERRAQELDAVLVLAPRIGDPRFGRLLGQCADAIAREPDEARRAMLEAAAVEGLVLDHQVDEIGDATRALLRQVGPDFARALARTPPAFVTSLGRCTLALLRPWLASTAVEGMVQA